MTVKVKKFDLETNYFSKSEWRKKRVNKRIIMFKKKKHKIKKVNKVILQN